MKQTETVSYVNQDKQKSFSLWKFMIYFFGALFLGVPFLNNNSAATPWSCLSGYASCSTATTLSVSIYNSYSWSIKINTGLTTHWIIISDQFRAGTSAVTIDVSATKTSSYTLSGWISAITGAGTGSYLNNVLLNLTDEKIYTLQAHYISNWEEVSSNTVSVWVDLTPPTTPINTGMPDNTVVNGSIVSLERSSSVDTGVWLFWYLVYISLNPLFSGTTPIFTLTNSLSLLSDDLPRGTLFYKIVAIDYLEHEAASLVHYFRNELPTYTILPWGVAFSGSMPTITSTQNHPSASIEWLSHMIPVPNISTGLLQIIIFDNQNYQTPREATLTPRPYLQYYILDNFLSNPIPDRILPDMLPANGADVDFITRSLPLAVINTQTIEKIIGPQEYPKQYGLAIILLFVISIQIIAYCLHKWHMNNYYK